MKIKVVCAMILMSNSVTRSMNTGDNPSNPLPQGTQSEVTIVIPTTRIVPTLKEGVYVPGQNARLSHKDAFPGIDFTRVDDGKLTAPTMPVDDFVTVTPRVGKNAKQMPALSKEEVQAILIRQRMQAIVAREIATAASTTGDDGKPTPPTNRFIIAGAQKGTQIPGLPEGTLTTLSNREQPPHTQAVIANAKKAALFHIRSYNALCAFAKDCEEENNAWESTQTAQRPNPQNPDQAA